MQKNQKELDIPESSQLREAISLEKQIKALKEDSSLVKWFGDKRGEIGNSKSDDLRVIARIPRCYRRSN